MDCERNVHRVGAAADYTARCLSHLRDRDRADSGPKRPCVRATRAHDDRREQPFVARDATYSVLPLVIASRAFHMEILAFFAVIHGGLFGPFETWGHDHS